MPPIFILLHPSSAYGSPLDATRLGRNLITPTCTACPPFLLRPSKKIKEKRSNEFLMNLFALYINLSVKITNHHQRKHIKWYKWLMQENNSSIVDYTRLNRQQIHLLLIPFRSSYSRNSHATTGKTSELKSPLKTEIPPRLT